MSTRTALAAELALAAGRMRLLTESKPDDTEAIVAEWESLLAEIDAVSRVGARRSLGQLGRGAAQESRLRCRTD